MSRSAAAPNLGATLEQRIDALHGWPAGEALPKAAEEVVAELLGRLEAGSLRSAVRSDDGSWAAVPWVKRGILVASGAGESGRLPPPGEARSMVRHHPASWTSTICPCGASAPRRVFAWFQAARRSAAALIWVQVWFACLRCT